LPLLAARSEETGTSSTPPGSSGTPPRVLVRHASRYPARSRPRLAARGRGERRQASVRSPGALALIRCRRVCRRHADSAYWVIGAGVLAAIVIGIVVGGWMWILTALAVVIGVVYVLGDRRLRRSESPEERMTSDPRV